MELIVLLENRHVGQLSTDRDGRVQFRYENAWLSDAGAIPLSLSLPLVASTHASQTVDAVIWGLLPDNERVLQQWGQRFHVSPRNAVALLSHVGEDCAGAVQFVRPENVADVLAGARDDVQWLSEHEVAQRLRLLRTDAGASRRMDDVGQFSLPGAQPKIALLGEDGRWGIPSGRIPTTHIIKPPTGLYEGYAENEHFCLRLAARLGFPACQSSVLRVEDQVAISVERYDRIRRNGHWWRVHQEDACQAMGVRPELKYQSDGGPAPQAIDRLLHTYSTDSSEDRRAFFGALVFNWLIGGSDAHAKNYSVLLAAGAQVRLAPLYDISSALPYDGIDPRKLRLAMKIGSNYRWHDIRVKDWVDQARLMDIPAELCRETLAAFSARLPDMALAVATELKEDGVTHPVVDRLVTHIADSAARCERMLRQAHMSEAP